MVILNVLFTLHGSLFERKQNACVTFNRMLFLIVM